MARPSSTGSSSVPATHISVLTSDWPKSGSVNSAA
jgi:hypothetical protein